MSRASLPPLEDDFARALLGSAQADDPPHAAYAKAAAALGVGMGLGVGAALPAAAVGTAGVAHLARWSGSLSAKLALLGVSGALLGGGVLLLQGSAPLKPVAQSGSGSVQHPVRASNAPSLPAPVERAADSQPAHAGPSKAVARPALLSPSTALPSTAPPSTAPRSLTATSSGRRPVHAAAAGVPAPARASGNSSLAEQVQSLDRARLALAAGDSSSALREIAHYRAAWPDGVFLTEANVLEIEALAARGERARAATGAADFVAAHPDSPQADRLRTLIHSKKR